MGSNKKTKEGLAGFEKTIAAINAGDYEEASKHKLWNYNTDGSIKGKTKCNVEKETEIIQDEKKLHEKQIEFIKEKESLKKTNKYTNKKVEIF